MKLSAVILIDGMRWRKLLHPSEMHKPIYQIAPTENQVSSLQWLKANGWKRDGGD